MKFRHGLAPGSEKVSDNDIVFRQYYTNRQEKFSSNLANKQHHRGATTRRHAGIVPLRCPETLFISHENANFLFSAFRVVQGEAKTPKIMGVAGQSCILHAGK